MFSLLSIPAILFLNSQFNQSRWGQRYLADSAWGICTPLICVKVTTLLTWTDLSSLNLIIYLVECKLIALDWISSDASIIGESTNEYVFCCWYICSIEKIEERFQDTFLRYSYEGWVEERESFLVGNSKFSPRKIWFQQFLQHNYLRHGRSWLEYVFLNLRIVYDIK